VFGFTAHLPVNITGAWSLRYNSTRIYTCQLKMLGLYLDTLIIGHFYAFVKYTKWINMAKEIAKDVLIMRFGQKATTTQ